ncbi:MAG: Dabb family protein [Firmicutes bacterium]|nr:Dabb family protein [Bacillota bacterium]
MKHLIIAKLKNRADKEKLIAPVQDLFNRLLEIPGIHSVHVRPCVIDLANRYDLMIEIDMDKDALETYAQSEPHLTWKREYGDLLESKAIFDYEE